MLSYKKSCTNLDPRKKCHHFDIKQHDLKLTRLQVDDQKRSEIHKKDKHQLLTQRFVSLLLTLLFHQIETVKGINHHQGKDHILG